MALATEKKPRKTQPLCLTCAHPRSFHSAGGKCRALGCVTCQAYDGPAATPTP